MDIAASGQINHALLQSREQENVQLCPLGKCSWIMTRSIDILSRHLEKTHPELLKITAGACPSLGCIKHIQDSLVEHLLEHMPEPINRPSCLACHYAPKPAHDVKVHLTSRACAGTCGAGGCQWPNVLMA
jgi:hypothetical protein